MDVELNVNGRARIVQTDPLKSLARVLREDLGLMGTKISCGEGECGACTVLVDDRAVTSCIVPVADAVGKRVVTIEGLSEGGRRDPLQEAFVEEGAVQCGFCTPGMILSAKALLMENPNPDEEDIREALEGNLCRCTGYLSIIRAVERAAATMREEDAASPRRKD